MPECGQGLARGGVTGLGLVAQSEQRLAAAGGNPGAGDGEDFIGG